MVYIKVQIKIKKKYKFSLKWICNKILHLKTLNISVCEDSNTDKKNYFKKNYVKKIGWGGRETSRQKKPLRKIALAGDIIDRPV